MVTHRLQIMMAVPVTHLMISGLYEVANDMQMISVDEPVGYKLCIECRSACKSNCKKQQQHTLNSIPVKYRVNGGSFVTETIASIAANTTVQYTFTTTANLSATGTYTIESIVSYPD